MNTTDLTRRLSAILSADVEGYSCHMRDDEDATVQTIRSIFVDILRFDGLVKSLQGRHSRESGSPEVIDFTGFPLSRE